MESKGHVLLLPMVAQGHINPILQFGKRLASRGFKITLVTTRFLSKTLHIRGCNFGLELISDGFDETGYGGAESFEVFFDVFRKVGSLTLMDVIKKYNQQGVNSTAHGQPISCLVCDSVLPWGLDVGKECGLVTAAFYTQTCSVSSIFYQAAQGNILSVPVEDENTVLVSIPGLPVLLAPRDFPSGVINRSESPEMAAALSLNLGQFSNLEKADWLLFNTFEKLETQVLKLMERIGRVRTIGPTLPSMYLDKRIEGDTDYNINVFNPSDSSYMNWLSGKEPGSVLYISFGSNTSHNEVQMEELVWGVKQSNKAFIWVVRETEQCKLPKEMLDKQGLLVPWCSQLEVLAHEAVGCFLTHCGWNSAMEALSLEVPMVAMPNMWDQPTNAKFLEDVWGVAIRVRADDKGIVRREELALCIREVMDGERGKTIKTNAARWRKAAKHAVDEGGSSDLNIEKFAISIMTA